MTEPSTHDWTRRGLLWAAPPPSKRGIAARQPSLWRLYFSDPRSAVLAFLASALIFGGGRKFLQGVRTRRAITALADPSPRIEEIEAAADHGRAGLIDLFRLLGTGDSPEARDAAGRALAKLWAGDELIVEEEKALVRRGFAVNWRARRRYPRGLNIPIPIEATYGVPFLTEDGPGVRPSNLEWSHRIMGAEQAHLEEWSGWQAGPGRAGFAIRPGDFPTNGPHRLAIASKVRVIHLTDAWELELPHLPFSFEFDPILAVDALLTLPDDTRGEVFARSIRLEARPTSDAPARFLDLGSDFLIREPPDLVVTSPLPSDLAHAMTLEIEGIPGQFRAGPVVVTDQGAGAKSEARRFPIETLASLPPGAIERPGDRKIRAILTSDPNLGWADPDVRSLWPGPMATDWVDVRVIRR